MADKIIRISKDKLKKAGWITLYAAAFLLALLIVLAYGLGAQSSFARSVSRVLHLPAAFVGTSVVSLDQFYANSSLADRVNQGRVPRAKILEQLIKNRVARNLVKEKNLVPSNAELEQSYNSLRLVTGEDNPEERYDLSRETFQQQIVKPSVVNTKLAIALASDEKANPEAYKKLKKVKQELGSGLSFEEAAARYSDDALSSQIGGDLGFITAKDLVAEYYQEVTKVQDANEHTVVTRHGIYIFKVTNRDEANEATRFRVKHIFIKTQDYDQWLKTKVKEHRVIKLV
jgi:parvulin-like peptidyl-prolyl isomerase